MFTNRLINELSPYLLQHAHNPVDWFPWGEEVLEKARLENKPIILSIGYTACHWCHVMESESFENEEIAAIMNLYFLSVKVDREERPDLDQIYMSAVQRISGQGGWPLHVFALPDGRPFFGGTYFKPGQWKALLTEINKIFTTEPEILRRQAEKITTSLQQHEWLSFGPNDHVYPIRDMAGAMEAWSTTFDPEEGGISGEPKFPMPINHLLLLRYSVIAKKPEIQDFVELSLRKMAFGGIYDHLGGGFARYSTDSYWKVPHFEKMLYDNAQMISLYSEAYQLSRNPLYKELVFETMGFVEQNLTAADGAFYASLDADSEGEEGKYYVWTEKEIRDLLGRDADLVCEYFGVLPHGNWEGGKNILFRKNTLELFLQQKGLDPNEYRPVVSKARGLLLEQRQKREPPALDDKILTSWNAMMASACFTAFQVFGESRFFELGHRNLEFLLNKMVKPDGGLWHRSKDLVTGIDGFLEDYAFLIEALLHFPPGINAVYLEKARSLATYLIKHFQSSTYNLFFFTSAEAKSLITRKIEVTDNVIPSANSSLARSLYRLGIVFQDHEYIDISDKMFSMTKDSMMAYPGSFSNWAIYFLERSIGIKTLAITGKEAVERCRSFQNHYLPFTQTVASPVESVVPILQNRFVSNKTMIYICTDTECLLPTGDVEEALRILEC